jgi:hypothetical protein
MFSGARFSLFATATIAARSIPGHLTEDRAHHAGIGYAGEDEARANERCTYKKLW